MANISSQVSSEIRFIPVIVYRERGDCRDYLNYWTHVDKGASRYDNFF